MKVGTIVVPNIKGQIVIPKEMRDALGIGVNVPLNLVVRGREISLYPIGELVTKIEAESSYLQLLEKTKGAWGGERWPKIKKGRREIERVASQKRKQAW